MIVPMKKATILCREVDRDRTLEVLRELGVLHLKPVEEPMGEDLEQARRYEEHVRRALEVLTRYESGSPSGRSVDQVVEETWRLIRRGHDLEERLEDLQQAVLRQEAFGDFDPDAIRALEQKGITIRLYSCDPRHLPDAPGDAVRVILSRERQQVCFAVISGEPVPIGARPFPLPQRSLGALRDEIQQCRQEQEEAWNGLASFAGDAALLAGEVQRAEEQVRYLEARNGMGREADIAYIRGFIPAENESLIRREAEGHGWGVVVQEPAPDEHPPTLLRNPSWVRIIQPVFAFMGIRPGYREVDVSLSFLFFLSIFFGMIVGDAGYGALFIAATWGLRRRLRAWSPQLVPLLLLMSACTVVWGLLTGTVFGMEALPGPLRAFEVKWLDDPNHLMLFCFFLGSVHLTLAHAWNAVRMSNSLRALEQIGWICTTWFMFLVARSMVLGAPWRWWYLILLFAGVPLIVLFMTPWGRIKAQWYQFVTLPLSIINNFVDVVSYVRLFAVGLATYAVGHAFNNMAVGDGVDSFLAGLAAAVVLFLGHALNIVMAMMSVLVHGLRLNALEFSTHLELEWSGQPYRPFASRKTPGSEQQEAAE